MRALILAVAVAASGCAGVGVVSRPYVDRPSWGSSGEGEAAVPTPVRTRDAATFVTYKLPVTVVDITATYEVRACAQQQVTVERPDQGLALVSVTIDSFVRADPDPRFWFDVDADRWSGFAVALAEAKLEVNGDQVLTSVNYRSQPQLTQTVTALVRLASVASGSMLLTAGSVQLVPCTDAVVTALQRRREHRALVEALDERLAALDLRIARQPTDDDANLGPTRANWQERGRIVEMRNAALLRILDIRDNELRFNVRYRWLPQADALERTFPIATDPVARMTPSQFNISATDPAHAAMRASLRTLMSFDLQLRPETQLPAPATQEDELSALPASCQLLDIHPPPPDGAPTTRLAESSVSPTQFTGVYHRNPVRVRAILSRTEGACREIGWGASAPLNLSVFQLGPLQRISIEGSPLFARSRGATFTNGALSSISAGANDATGPAALGALSDVADAQRQAELSEIARDTAELTALTALAKAREAYNETLE
ncbi:MAG: hypothetical protein H7124_11260 [Phycisphaerales bacterium]|nr:hypothetical protein [Hyphomonadaceae bacterium]